MFRRLSKKVTVAIAILFLLCTLMLVGLSQDTDNTLNKIEELELLFEGALVRSDQDLPDTGLIVFTAESFQSLKDNKSMLNDLNNAVKEKRPVLALEVSPTEFFEYVEVQNFEQLSDPPVTPGMIDVIGITFRDGDHIPIIIQGSIEAKFSAERIKEIIISEFELLESNQRGDISDHWIPVHDRHIFFNITGGSARDTLEYYYSDLYDQWIGKVHR